VMSLGGDEMTYCFGCRKCFFTFGGFEWDRVIPEGGLLCPACKAPFYVVSEKESGRLWAKRKRQIEKQCNIENQKEIARSGTLRDALGRKGA
jgi:hypothetical protein